MVKKEKKAVVALSGGVDSAFTAFLLKEAGYRTEAAFMRLWAEPGLKKYQQAAEARARRVADILKIPFHVFDLKKDFKKRIVDRFLLEHRKGLTPNPCVFCNRQIKFGLLPQKAAGRSTDYLASGHYARIVYDQKSGFYRLLKAKDKNKDQSYFLWQLNQKHLKRLLFPLGQWQKKDVEDKARQAGLPFKKVASSQEICFIKGGVEAFLKKHLTSRPGLIVDSRRNILGRHRGLHFYTVGQRKGIRLSQGPYYVLKKELKNNLLIVTKDKKDLSVRRITVGRANWLAGREPDLPLKIKARIRYHGPATAALIKPEGKRKYQLLFRGSQQAATPGQSAVFYQGEELLGGGIML